MHSLVFTVPICRFEVLVDETGAMYNAKTKVQSIPNFRPCSNHYHCADLAGSTGLSTFIELIIPYQLHWIVVKDVMNCDGIYPINSTVDTNPMQSTPGHWCRRKKGGCETWQMAIFSRQGLGIKFEAPWCSWGLQLYQMILQTSFLRCRCSSD